MSPDYSRTFKDYKSYSRNIYWCACFETFCDKLLNCVLYRSSIPYNGFVGWVLRATNILSLSTLPVRCSDIMLCKPRDNRHCHPWASLSSVKEIDVWPPREVTVVLAISWLWHSFNSCVRWNIKTNLKCALCQALDWLLLVRVAWLSLAGFHPPALQAFSNTGLSGYFSNINPPTTKLSTTLTRPGLVLISNNFV